MRPHLRRLSGRPRQLLRPVHRRPPRRRRSECVSTVNARVNVNAENNAGTPSTANSTHGDPG
ncbi:hypothetical protein ACOBQX_01870 [Actinokineospora sp. G85]|uniref:hypothetical protein n=1 Tax=Actinokineospora sp. G85 TaxID=3406626 RepID=UPI003C73558A